MKIDLRAMKVVLLLVLALLPLPAVSAEFAAKRFSSIVDNGVTMWHVPGMAVAIVVEGELVFQRGFGVSAADGGEFVDFVCVNEAGD